MSIEAIRELGTLASVCPELNMANYTEDDVRHLNDWAIEMSLLVEKFAAIQQAEANQPAADTKLYTTPQPVQAPQAVVTDEQIESCALEAGFSVESTGSIWAVDGYVGTRVDPGLRKFARAILAQRPERVPMTDEQIRSMCKQGWVFETVRQWVHVIEAHHGITAQAKKETP